MEITTEDIIDEYKNEYKQKLINYLNERLKNAKEQYNDEFHKDLQQYIKGEMDFY